MAHADEAELYINGEPVGEVHVQRRGQSWSHGQFHPTSAFCRFAPLFGRWSLLMHAGGNYECLSKAAGAALREAEFEIDRLHAELHIPERDEWVTCSQLNIDGPMIEWKTF
jgi:hypothetical protein